jgi:hypothetical protein
MQYKRAITEHKSLDLSSLEGSVDRKTDRSSNKGRKLKE